MPVGTVIRIITVVVAFGMLATGAQAREFPDHPCWQETADQNLQAVLSACTDAIALFEGDENALGFAYVRRAGIHGLLGNHQKSTGDMEQARRFLESSEARKSGDPQLVKMLAWAYRELDMPEEADRIYGQAIEISDDWQARLSRCVARTDLGRYAGALSDCQIAKTRYAIVADQFGPNLDIAFFTALSLNELGRPNEAYEVAISEISHPDINGRLYYQALVGLWNAGRHAEVPALFEEGYRRYPDDPDIHIFFDQTGIER